MENKRYSLNLDELESDIEVEIYGIVFKVNDIKSIDYYNSIKSGDIEIIDKEIEDILGKDSINRINEIRKKDGKKELNLGLKLSLLLKLAEIDTHKNIMDVSNTATNSIRNTTATIEQTKKQFSNFYNRNRKINRRYRRY